MDAYFSHLVIVETKTELFFSSHHQKNSGVLSLMTHHFLFLSFYSLDSNCLGAEGAAAIAEALKVNKTLTSLK